MNNKSSKKKLCWNCEGSVDRDAENCIYCGVYLHPEDKSKDPEEDYQPDLFEPPYPPEEEVEKKGLPVSPYTATPAHPSENPEPKKPLLVGDDLGVLQRQKGEIRAIVLPTLFLLSGALFFVFGMVLYLFSKDGIFTIRWDANYWFIYLFFSLPLLFIGWRTLRYLEERDEL